MHSTLSKTLRLCAGLLALAALTAAGCGPRTATVTGKVTYKGNVVKGGRVVFASEKGPSVLAVIGEDGSYTAEHVPVGNVKIAVQTKYLGVAAGMGKAGAPPKDAGGPDGQKPGKLSPEEAARKFVAIPSSYEDAETSGLTYTVRGGSQEHDLVLVGNLDKGSGGSKDKPKGSGSGPPK
jgi:hypothetical protein